MKTHSSNEEFQKFFSQEENIILESIKNNKTGLTSTSENGSNFLHWACSQINVIKYLIEKEGYKNTPNNDGTTPFHFACGSGNLEAVKYFVEELKTDINLKDANGITPLHVACTRIKPNLELIKILVDAKTDVNLKDNKGYTTLHAACIRRNPNLGLIKILVDAKTDVNLKDNKGYTTLSCAFLNGNLELVKYIIEEIKVDVNLKDAYGITPLHYAITNQRLEAFKYLIEEKKVDVNLKDGRGDTPLNSTCRFIAYAQKEKTFETVKFLIEAKAEIKIQNNINNTPFMSLCLNENNSLKPLEYLFQNESKLTQRELEPFCKIGEFSEIFKGFCNDIYRDVCFNFKQTTAFTLIASLKIFANEKLVGKIFPKPIIKMIINLIDIKQKFAEKLNEEFLQKFDINQNQAQNITKFLLENACSDSILNKEWHIENEAIKEIGKFLVGDISELDV